MYRKIAHSKQDRVCNKSVHLITVIKKWSPERSFAQMKRRSLKQTPILRLKINHSYKKVPKCWVCCDSWFMTNAWSIHEKWMKCKRLTNLTLNTCCNLWLIRGQFAKNEEKTLRLYSHSETQILKRLGYSAT